ncbi:MAG: RNA-guided pseudouridylation complex pseudouridine synthase subunit Cbf5 [archaeon]|nr:RNA-guided pseudouridylation complex pseudouridine synthase subunit Cbf5 [archaeon]
MEKSTKELLQFSILNLDKPSGPTSFNVSDFVRKKVKESGVGKTSHFGTLDPKVTGVLPIALGRACKLTGFFLGHDKEYVGIMHVHEEISIEKLQETINKKFLGKIMQKPPVKSRVKRELREREIISFEILESDDKRNFLFKAKVQGGTYIRKLIDDLGTELGIGAHMLELRRTQAGIFSEEDSRFVNLYDFEKYVEEYKAGNDKNLRKILIPGEEAIKRVFSVVQVKEAEIRKLWTGKPLFVKDIIGQAEIKEDEKFALFCKEKFIGIYRKTDERGIFARPEFVFQPVR